MFNLFRNRTVQAPKNEVELTAELRQATNTLLDSVKGQSPEVIQRAKDLVGRMHEQSQAETEYRALVVHIQSCNIQITDEMQAAANKIRMGR